jgi:hypothetical protein
MGGRGGRGRGRTSGQNVDGSVNLRFLLKEIPKTTIGMEITDPAGKIAARYSTKPEEKESRMTVKPGINRVRWNIRYPGADTFAGMILWGGGTQGPRAVPGQYTATIKIGEVEYSMPFEIKIDPRISSTPKDLQEQFDFMVTLRDKLSTVNNSIKQIRDIRGQIQALNVRLKKHDKFKSLRESGEALVKKLTTVEEALYQTKNQSSQDPLNYPIRLNNRLSALISVVDTGDNSPTVQSRQVFAMLEKEIDQKLKEFSQLLSSDVPRFNNEVKKAKVPAIFIDAGEDE